MNKLGLLLAAASLTCLVGCGPGDTFFFPSYENMADDYDLTEVEIYQSDIHSGENSTTILVPPEISGTLILTKEKTYNLDVTIQGKHITRSGTFYIEIGGNLTSAIILRDAAITRTGNMILSIRDDGLKLASVEVGSSGIWSIMSLVFARS
jgi:hypothetical protein